MNGGMLNGLYKWAIDALLPTALVVGTGFGIYALTTQSNYFDAPPPIQSNLQQAESQGHIFMGPSLFGQQQQNGQISVPSQPPPPSYTDQGQTLSAHQQDANDQYGASGGSAYTSTETEADIAELKSAIREAVAHLSDPLVAGALVAQPQPEWARELTLLCRQLAKDVQDLKRHRKEGGGEDGDHHGDDENAHEARSPPPSLEERLQVAHQALYDMCIANGKFEVPASESGEDLCGDNNNDNNDNNEDGGAEGADSDGESNNKDATMTFTVTPKLSSGIDCLKMYLSKLIEFPETPRYRRLTTSNKTFAKSVAVLEGHDAVLHSVGFCKTEGVGYEWDWFERSELGQQDGAKKEQDGEVEPARPSTEEAVAVLKAMEGAMIRAKAGDLGWFSADAAHMPKADHEPGEDEGGSPKEKNLENF